MNFSRCRTQLKIVTRKALMGALIKMRFNISGGMKAIYIKITEIYSPGDQ